MKNPGSTSSVLAAFPVKGIFTGREAAAYVGLSPTRLFLMRGCGCGPASIVVAGKRVYKRDDLDLFKATLLSHVGLTLDEGRYTIKKRDAALDPLMGLLSAHAFRRRLTLMLMIGMLIVGGLMSALLF